MFYVFMDYNEETGKKVLKKNACISKYGKH